MKKRIVTILVCMLLMTYSLVIVFDVEAVKESGNTLYVGGSGQGNYTRIQDAIDNASDGDTVFVYKGTYYENLIVNRQISLIGEDRNSTLIDGRRKSSTVAIYKSGVKLSGFTIQNSGNTWYHDGGIQIWNWDHNSHNNIITNNIIKENYDGIYLYYTNNNQINNNIIINNRHAGLYLHSGVDENNISDNMITENKDQGIYLCNSDSNIISNNFISDNKGLGIYFEESGYNEVNKNHLINMSRGIVIMDRSWGNIIFNNMINSNELGITIFSNLNTIVSYNNFINNELDATFIYFFIHIIVSGRMTQWNNNYWDDLKYSPVKLIRGFIGIIYLGSYVTIMTIPWINFDWHPVKEPYDIP